MVWHVYRYWPKRFLCTLLIPSPPSPSPPPRPSSIHGLMVKLTELKCSCLIYVEFKRSQHFQSVWWICLSIWYDDRYWPELLLSTILIPAHGHKGHGHAFSILTHICLVDPSIFINWTSPFPILGVSGVLFHFYSVSTRYSAASDLGMHCLPMSQKWDARLIGVKV